MTQKKETVQVQYGQLGHSAFVPTGRQPDWSSPASSTAFAAPSSKPLCQEALTLPAGHPFESDITAEAVFGPDIMNQPTAVKFNGAATPSLRQGHQDPASTLPDDVFCETEPPMHQLAQSYNNPRQGARRSRGGRQSANGYASRGGHAYGRCVPDKASQAFADVLLPDSPLKPQCTLLAGVQALIVQHLVREMQLASRIIGVPSAGGVAGAVGPSTAQ